MIPLYLVTTAELTQRGSWKSTLRLVLLLTDSRITLGASGGSVTISKQGNVRRLQQEKGALV